MAWRVLFDHRQALPNSGPGTWRDYNNNDIPPKHADFNVRQIRELMSNYGPLSEIWLDMGKPTPEQSRRFIDAVHSLQPNCMVRGRVFNHQGDCSIMGDNSMPNTVIEASSGESVGENGLSG